MEESRLCQVELLQLLRTGQFSTVYRVRLKTTGKHLALKKIPEQERFESREEELCRRMRSNFVVRTVDVYRGEGEVNVLMELYDWSLKDFIQGEERLEYLVFKAICYQMARALFYVHSKAVTHRDIRPDNFLMKKNGRVVLSDFGSAKTLRKGESSLAYLNSRSYRAP
jgi:serine/threonine protein kinase